MFQFGINMIKLCFVSVYLNIFVSTLCFQLSPVESNVYYLKFKFTETIKDTNKKKFKWPNSKTRETAPDTARTMTLPGCIFTCYISMSWTIFSSKQRFAAVFVVLVLSIRKQRMLPNKCHLPLARLLKVDQWSLPTYIIAHFILIVFVCPNKSIWY